jgi:hypothetical protein
MDKEAEKLVMARASPPAENSGSNRVHASTNANS